MKERPAEDKNLLVMEALFEGFTPDEMFDHWTKPELLALWNADDAVSDPRPGGAYFIDYKDLGWKVSGTYKVFSRPNHLSIGWKWDHAGGVVENTVDVTFTTPETGGTLVVLRQGPFGDSEQALTLRQAVAEGWLHFGSRLAGLRAGDVNMESSMG